MTGRALSPTSKPSLVVLTNDSSQTAPQEKRFQTNAALTERLDLTPELIIIRVLPDAPLPQFVPGQYAELAIIEEVPDSKERDGDSLGRLVRKAYSIASAPDDPRGLEFYITLVETGDLTPRLWRLNPGDRLWINPKIKGKFTLGPVLPGKDLLLFATGTGIAPYISMFRAYKNNPPWRQIIFFHGVRSSADFGYADELHAAAAADSRVIYFPSVTREPAWRGLHGRITTLFSSGAYEEALGKRFVPEECQVMLCGNPAMIDEMQLLLESRGFKIHSKKDPGQIHVERYW